MMELGKMLYDIWVAKNLKNAIIVEEKWEDLQQLDQQAWNEAAEEFIYQVRS